MTKREENMKTYEIVQGKGTNQGIKCLRCGLTSWHYMDVEKKYCGNCHIFHEDEEFKQFLKKLEQPKILRVLKRLAKI